MNAIDPALRAADEPLVLGAPVARTRGRHWLAMLSFLVMVAAPTALSGWYLYTDAADQYASRIAFSVRANDSTAPLEIFGAITQLGSSSAMTDGQILYDFIQSQQAVREVEAAVPLEDIYNRAEHDWVFSLGRDQPVEVLVDYWNWMTDVSIDPASGILTVEARAFAPEDARAIAEALLTASAHLVNQLSDDSRADAVRFAKLELAEAEERLRAIRARLRDFRDIEQEVDPTQNVGVAMGLVATLEEELARAQVQLDSLRGVLDGDAPRALALKRMIATLKARIAAERTRLGSGDASPDGTDRPLSEVVGDFEELVVDREFAEQAYTLALATYEQALAEARRRHRYLAPHIRPTLSEEAEYPQREIWLLGIGLLSLFTWSILLLAGYNVADRR